MDRDPDYGIDRRDGCIVMGEISMNISQLEYGKSVRGKVFDAQTKEPLTNAKLILSIKQNGSTEKKKISTDENGIYQSDVLHGKLKKIEVEYLGYRNLKIDLKKQKHYTQQRL
ncbi:hypothetical protein GTQ34_00880 [Muricauda sp. JGD-17]|uniref:Carboxypeptidase-like protein n=1 Tax=Flagellimonas ochracea TaxID=2696472 RepID=A0A964WW58_9FLAO|nr:carboxypeptidase-like regulatory domain-containing protein [Allomuricauda ochracea]NAY90458.1 hypothetical protein [Allomuricauda ochracea]